MMTVADSMVNAAGSAAKWTAQPSSNPLPVMVTLAPA